MSEIPEYTQDGLPIVTQGTRETLIEYIRREYRKHRDMSSVFRPLTARMNNENPQMDILRDNMFELLQEQDPNLVEDFLDGYDAGLKQGILLGNELMRRQQEALKLKRGFS